MSDVEDYLQEGFDPRAVTVPRLRSILVTHNIQFGNAKKPQLVALVEEHIMPAVPKLREQRARAKRSSMGIVNAGSADDNPAWDDYDLAPPPSARRSKSPRKSSTRASSSRIKSEEVEDTPVQRSPAKRASRSVSRALSHAEETPEYEAPRSVRRNRRTVTPQIKSEPDDDMPSLQEDSVFTDDNPFQGKSSPSQPKTPGSRRRTSDFKSNRSSLEGSVRRRTGEYEDVKPLIVPKTRHQFTPQYDDDDDDDEDDDEDALEGSSCSFARASTNLGQFIDACLLPRACTNNCTGLEPPTDACLREHANKSLRPTLRHQLSIRVRSTVDVGAGTILSQF